MGNNVADLNPSSHNSFILFMHLEIKTEVDTKEVLSLKFSEISLPQRFEKTPNFP